MDANIKTDLIDYFLHILAQLRTNNCASFLCKEDSLSSMLGSFYHFTSYSQHYQQELYKTPKSMQ